MDPKRLQLDIQDKSSFPKYRQIVRSVIDNIEQGNLEAGDVLPSINQVSFDYLLSKDTVERAYKILKDDGVIRAVKGKGFYVHHSTPESKLRVLVLFNKLSSYKKVVYNKMAHDLFEKANITFYVYHCRYDLFENILKENKYGYNYYVIMPHFIDFDQEKVVKQLQTIDPSKLILVDNLIEGFDQFKGGVYQDFKLDIYDAMCNGLAELRRYKKLILVFPANPVYPYPVTILEGFKRFCGLQNFEFEVISEVTEDLELRKESVYVIIEESDLAKLIKLTRSQHMKISKDVGILSYNDTPLKEVLENGISVMTTDFEKMGESVANIILNRSEGLIKNDFQLILRNSL
ncbi:MAG: GntR family transcriptional regulator [Marinoscillum sp.]